ncbi:hypothetical protein ACFWNI_07715 [Streptomyces sp. NPDC058377]|uniref:hypothetical protein n=1 Tax=Streptomyces sp. NPDC058377 TaxID=3346468 RepID=UPI00365B160C
MSKLVCTGRPFGRRFGGEGGQEGQGESVVSLARRLGTPTPGSLRKYSHFLPRAGARGSAAIDAIFA